MENGISSDSQEQKVNISRRKFLHGVIAVAGAIVVGGSIYDRRTRYEIAGQEIEEELKAQGTPRPTETEFENLRDQQVIEKYGKARNFLDTLGQIGGSGMVGYGTGMLTANRVVEKLVNFLDAQEIKTTYLPKDNQPK